MKNMTPEIVQQSVLWTKRPDSFTKKRYPAGQSFDRVGLTLSAKGWTASIQWKGTVGARGKGKTISEALNAAVALAERDWNCEIHFVDHN